MGGCCRLCGNFVSLVFCILFNCWINKDRLWVSLHKVQFVNKVPCLRTMRWSAVLGFEVVFLLLSVWDGSSVQSLWFSTQCFILWKLVRLLSSPTVMGNKCESLVCQLQAYFLLCVTACSAAQASATSVQKQIGNIDFCVWSLVIMDCANFPLQQSIDCASFPDQGLLLKFWSRL